MAAASRSGGVEGGDLVVGVGALLTAEERDGVHDVVGELASSSPGRHPRVGLGMDRRPEGHRDLGQPRPPGPHRLDLIGAAQADGHDGYASGQRQPADTGAPAIEPTVTRASYWIHMQLHKKS